ncbi:MAG: hypothetical protein JW941_00210, partial [Candidatus Coatesbacteria bacterium]|nr:hypothetical protein [Candidatus Coatesbacteria bacterium]
LATTSPHYTTASETYLNQNSCTDSYEEPNMKGPHDEGLSREFGNIPAVEALVSTTTASFVLPY